MSDDPPRSPPFSKFRTKDLVQGAAVLLAVAFSLNAARILNNSPKSQDWYLANFDSGAIWLGLALLALVVAAWPPVRVRTPAIREAVLRIWNDHYLEALLFVAIILIGTFMRFFHFGTSFPPDIGLCCEEHINGGIAYDALHGDRPLLFPLVRWTSALGFLTFGETSWGLRFFFPVMGVATLVIFYFLLRQLVSVQAALFGLALYAIAWWPSLRNRQTTGGTIYAVLLAFLIVRGIRTRSTLTFLAAGVVAGLMSYEYEAFRVMPMIAVAFLGLAAARVVLFDGPLAAARQRAVDLLRVAWRPALAFLMAAGIVLIPMIVGTHQGKNLYLTSVDRNANTRDGSRIADEWQDQLRWATTMFLPFSSTDYPTSLPREVPGTHLFDPLTASIVVLGFAAGVVSFRRGYRAWFAMWVGGVLVGGALLLGDFAPWSFFGLVPILIALAAYAVDDAGTFLKRFGEPATRGLTVLLVLVFAFTVWWNADTLFNDVEDNIEVQRVYGGEISFMYAMCDYLNSQPDDNYAFAYSNAVLTDGFAADRSTDAAEHRAWSDFIWACHGLNGRALPAPQEAWPLRELPEGPVTLIFADPIVPAEDLIAELNTAYPSLGQSDYRVTGPADTYELLAYDFARGSELQRPGLWGAYTSPDGTTASRLDSFPIVETASAPLEPPYAVRWTGVLYVDQTTVGSIQPVNDPAARVLVDGVEGPREFIPGWHAIEINLDVVELSQVTSLAWQDADGVTTPIDPFDFFPLTNLTGWRHTRSMGLAGSPDQLTTQRHDFTPHLALASVLRLATGSELFVTQERWEGVITVEEETALALTAEFRGGFVSLRIDGEIAAEGDADNPEGTLLQTTATLDAGRHRVELVQTLDREPTWSGASLSITDARGVSPIVRPY